MADMTGSWKWRRASKCESRACVEVAFGEGVVLLRNSTDPQGLALRFTTEEWQVFCAGVESGELRG